MGNYKKNVRPLNKATNLFVKWLKDNGGDNIDDDKPQACDEWDYYCVISGFIGECLYSVSFECWHGNIKIDYEDESNKYRGLSIDDFLALID